MQMKAPDGPDLLASRRCPIFCKPIQKSGCTTLKNLFYRLDEGRWLDDPTSIHRRQRDLLRFVNDPGEAEKMARGARGFAVIRKPSDRFLSFYFDKCVVSGGQGPDFPWLAERLARDHGVKIDPGADVAAHQANLDAVLDFIAANMAGATDLRRDPHWMPQAIVLRQAQGVPLHHIALEHMAEGLERLAADAVPEIGDLLRAAPRFNDGGARDVDAAALLTRPLVQRLRSMFRADYRLYRAAVAGFEAGGPGAPPAA